MNRKRILSAALASALLFAPFLGQTSSVLANSFYANQTNAERADITNWVANDTEQISSNISSQHIDVNNLDQSKYIIQWGDTLSGISAATGISVRKLVYDNNIKNVDLIYAGDTLILNRDGYVPADWYYQGDGTWVANTKVTINNFIDNSDNTVNINVSPVTVNDSSTNKSTNVYASPADSNANFGSTTAAADSDTDTTNASSDDTSSTTSAILDDDEFADAISDKLADKLGLEDESALSVDFTEQDEDTATDSESSDTEDEDAESVDDESSDEANEDSDSETETLYDEDQPIVTSNTKQTTKNANKLAKKIYRQLKEDNKLSDITDADDIEVIVIATDDGFDFNVALPTDDDSSDSAANTDESSDDSDSETEDNDDDTEFEEDSSDESDTEASNTAVTTSSNEDTSTDVDE
ncbi:LysM peptidoglycan-binding domain-containing protein [Loigolactobacillus coryniformis]|uniref:LysM peptidoglycan-binding domain-containing protein n=1 Tax=Loigolactobacillus coryniformis TaxID=1610 RepID=UPI001C5FC9AF|nr:LysM domain-containing protein [Loigolactobacillus coryniformis]MBW4801216.1 LysM peptidoglycan-binding domain-containing protein [Loigolactobacillus coryniformis subsp. torquens]MBW4803919.1 LysM peptidoglycan-binding domain-containing protein [Loigolactobacillus coryniformis subsp. torquens]